MTYRFFLLLLFIAALPVASAATSSDAPSLPLQAGEQLTYRVSWAIVPGAGRITIEATADPASSPPRLVVNTTTATRGLAKMLLPFEAEGQSTYDATTGRLLTLRDVSTKRRKTTERTVTFDYAQREALYRSSTSSEPRTLPIPEGNPSDLIMALLQTRTWDLKPGESRDALVLFDDDFYELTIHALRYEEVRTPLGKFRTLVLEPRMEKTAPKGMFRKGASVHVWIAENAPHLPVKFEVEFNIGTGTATLESYTPPASTSPSAPPAAARP